MTHEGHCLCGAVQFSSSTDPVDVGYCHCRMCQLLSGAAALPWASFRAEDFSYTEGEPSIYRSSTHGQREFCGRCGSQIAFRNTDTSTTVDVNVGTLSDAEKVRPRSHIYCESRISWFDIDDDLPRHPGPGPE